MKLFRTLDRRGLPLCAGLVGALCLGVTTAAWAQEAAPVANGYVCLSNSCATLTTIAKPASADTNRPALPRLAAGPQTRESLLASLTEEERATAQVTETARNGMTTIEVRYQKPNGGIGSRTVSFATPPK